MFKTLLLKHFLFDWYIFERFWVLNLLRMRLVGYRLGECLICSIPAAAPHINRIHDINRCMKYIYISVDKLLSCIENQNNHIFLLGTSGLGEKQGLWAMILKQFCLLSLAGSPSQHSVSPSAFCDMSSHQLAFHSLAVAWGYPMSTSHLSHVHCTVAPQ